MIKKRLYQPTYIKEILDRFGFSFSKGLGQNFLIDGNIIRSIVENSNITDEDVVLEVGPGFGTLTEELALSAKKVVSVELDKRLPDILKVTLADYDNVEIINEDILKVNIEELRNQYCPNGKFKVVANLPYYVTTPILESLIKDKEYIHTITVMVQDEVARRMVADETNKEYGSLSLFIRYHGDAEIITNAPKSVFMPSPKVDSAVVKITLKNKPHGVEEKLLFDLIHSGFSKRRKTILNSLTSGFVNISKDELVNILDALGLQHNLRAEKLSLDDFISIAKKIESLRTV